MKASFGVVLAVLMIAAGAEAFHETHPYHGSRVNGATMLMTNANWKRAQSELKASSKSVSPKVRTRVLYNGSLSKKEVLLTFDDGPHPSATPELLRILAVKHVPATFFVVGEMAEKHPELIRQIKAAGQTLGNHTFSHVTLTKLTSTERRIEYRADNDLVHRLTGVQMHFCRPPGGDTNRAVLQAAQDEDMTTVLWTDDPADYANPGKSLVSQRVLRRLSPGGIILLHDGSKDTLRQLGHLIDVIRAKGYTFVTPDVMVSHLRLR